MINRDLLKLSLLVFLVCSTQFAIVPLLHAEEATVSTPLDTTKAEPNEQPAQNSIGTDPLVIEDPTQQATAVIDQTVTDPNNNAPAQEDSSKNNIAKLVTKLSDSKGNLVKIGLLNTIDYSTLNFSDLANQAALSAIKRYHDFDIQLIKELLPALTLESFRNVVVKYHIDVVIVAVIKPTNFDVFLFDRRTPYSIYAHSETLPEEVQYALTGPLVEEYTNAGIRRILYAYLQNQYYELPREMGVAFTSAEIPRWIASAQSFATINREILSKFYGSAGVGAALSIGENRDVWNSNLIGIALGYRLFKDLYLETSINMFAYNTFAGSIKYLFSNKESPIRYSVGVGAATLTNMHTLNYDQKYTQGLSGEYVVTSAAIIFPIINVHFKLESQLMLGKGKAIFTLVPGLFMFF